MCLAVPMKVMKLLPPDRAIVEADGMSMEASLKLVEKVKVGDYVIVHTGFALEVLDLEEAEKTLEIFNEIIKAEEEKFSPHELENI
ncbi:MAG TPA: HypC/HybG/HupF family hydrogenase formation chaperone [Anaerolineae bacterium]|nr:HypC/HybG/HupF family hydrogenase formation chaperone [Anaerolineae bacterium]